MDLRAIDADNYYSDFDIVRIFDRLKILKSCIYILSLEFIQKNFVANRGFEWMDWMADIAGAIIGAAVVLVLQRRAEKG